MKRLLLLAFFVTLGIDADAQEARVIAEVAASSDRIVKGAPFSADGISESVQVLADGNRIVRSSTTKMYRNSEGRFRREMENTSSNVFGTMFSTGEGITILDPVAGRRLMVDDSLKTVRISSLVLAPGSAWTTTTTKSGNTEERTTTIVRSMQTAKAAEELAAAANRSNSVAFTYSFPGGFVPGRPYETKTEELGSRDFEGVMAEGKRTTTTIPAGAIGNERPIEIVYERWYSNELQLTVFSRHNDPRFGEQTYRLTNLVRTEPNASLFLAPSGYKVVTVPSNVYRMVPQAPLFPSSPAGVRVNLEKPEPPTPPGTVPAKRP
jgi:hypothetical protein